MKVFEIAEDKLYSFLDMVLKHAGMALHPHVQALIASLKPKEEPKPDTQEQKTP